MKTVTKEVYHGAEAQVILSYEDQLNRPKYNKDPHWDFEVYEQTRQQVDQQVYWQVQRQILNTLREG